MSTKRRPHTMMKLNELLSPAALHHSQAPTANLPSSPAALSYFAVAGLTMLYLVVAVAHAVLAPLTTGPDELAHYEYARFIAEHGRLPLDNRERQQASYKSDQPPLYHILAALPMALVDLSGPPFLKRVSDHPRRQLIERTRHAWGLYNTEDERWPYRAEVLRWQMGRWVAILFGAATVAMTFFIARDLFARLPAPPSRRAVEILPALAAAALVAFIPRFVLTGSMLNYETTQALVAALFLWLLLRLKAPRFTFKALLLGLCTGLAILTKLSALILLLEVVLALGLIGRAQGWSRMVWLRGVFITLITAVVVVSLWFGFNVYQFNTVARDGLWVGLLRPLIAADSSDATTNQLLSLLTEGQAGFSGAMESLESGPPWDWAAIFFRTFWMVGIETVQPLAPWALVVALGLCLAAAYGLMQLWQQSDQRPTTNDQQRTKGNGPLTTSPSSRLTLALLLLHLILPFLLPLLRYVVTFSLADTAQGRHVLFPAAPAFAILMVWGLQGIKYQWSEHYVLRFLPLVPGFFVMIWTGVQLWTMTWAYNPPLPVSTLPAAAAQATQPLQRPLNEFITLVGYQNQVDPQEHILRLELIWQATQVSLVDYLTEVNLIDSQGQPMAQWLGYAAGGRYPTRAWDKGDIVRDTVWLPVAGLASGRYQLTLNLIPTSQNFAPEQVVSTFTLTDLELQNPGLRLFNKALPFTDQAVAAAGYTVWREGQALTTPEPFRYRETVLITFSPLLPQQQRRVRLVGSAPEAIDHGSPNLNDLPTFAPDRELNDMALFIVGPNWPSGDYHLQVTLTSPDSSGDSREQLVNSERVLHLTDRWQRQFSEPPLSHRVEANFANQVKLLGYDLGANRAQPGGGIPLTLYWQGLDWMGQDYTIFAKLLAADQTVHGGRERLPREGYRTIYWAPGEIITDSFGIPVAAAAPAGVYYINIGLYRLVGQQAVSLPLVQNGQLLDVTSLNIGPLKIGGPPPGLAIAAAKPQVTLNQPFGLGPNLTLLGYDLADEAGQAIAGPAAALSTLHLTLYWRSEAPLPADYTTFVHVRDEAGQTIAQKDGPPLNGAYPTSLWDPGEIIADTVQVSLPAALPSGEYQVIVGLYDLASGVRLTVPGSPDNGLLLRKVAISPP